MKKLLCLIFSLAMLLSFAACDQKNAQEETKEELRVEDVVKELAITMQKRNLGVATREEVRSLYSDAWWGKYDDAYFEEFYNSYLTDSETGKLKSDLLKEMVGENYVFTIEIKKMEFIENKDDCARYEAMFESLYGYDVTVEAICVFAHIIRVEGDKDTYELPEIENDYVCKINGKWCYGR